MPKFENDSVVSVSTSSREPALLGEGSNNEGVRGVSHNAHAGVVGVNDFAPAAPPGAGGNAGWFESAQGEGVRGWSKTPHHGGVVGVNTAGGSGVFGTSDDGPGVVGESRKHSGVRGMSHHAHGAVVGVNDFAPPDSPGGGGNGGWFESAQGEGVRGVANNPHHGGVVGINTAGGAGVFATSDNGPGAFGESKKAAGLVGISQQDVGLFAKGGRLAALFDGDVEVNGDIKLANADCAEDFDIAEAASMEPGTVMVLSTGSGELLESRRAYDRRVAGVISGAGKYKPGILLDRQSSQGARAPLALLGKVYCKVDASCEAIEVGDLLTTSDRPGHAMKATDSLRAFGAIIGKALRPFSEGQGLIPILVTLQ